MDNPIAILHITDVHNGVKNVSAKDIQIGLKSTILDDPKYQKVKAINITGDFYDLALNHSGEDAMVTHETIALILTWCKAHDIVCLLLRGTISHDAKQTQWFEIINKHIGAKLYHFTQLGVHWIPELNMRVLAVPDEVAKPRVKTDAMIKALLEEHNLDFVDIALTHGYYDFHLPNHKVEEGHSSDYLSSIVRWIVFNGHVHTKSLVSKILTGGSWGRYRHGEEESKGAHLVTLKPDHTFTAKFIKNKHLTEFVTVDVKGLTVEDTITKVEKRLGSFPDDRRSFCRLHYRRDDQAANTLGYLTERYPLVTFTTLVDETKTTNLLEGESLDTKIQGVQFNKENFVPLAEEYLKKHSPNDQCYQRALATFKELCT